MFEKVADYIHVERGVIPAEVCERLLTMIKAERWQPSGEMRQMPRFWCP